MKSIIICTMRRIVSGMHVTYKLELSFSRNVSIFLNYWTQRPDFLHSWRRFGVFLIAKTFKPALGSTQPPNQWIPGALSPGVKLVRREAYHSPPSGAEFKKAWSYGYETWSLILREEHRQGF
jgi:hypothetical protein